MVNWVFSNRISKKSEALAGMLLKLLPLGVTIKDDIKDEEVLKEVAGMRDAGCAGRIG